MRILKAAAGFMAGVCFSSAALAQFAGGSGSISDPYQVQTPEQFANISANPSYWSSSFELISDLNMARYDGIGENTNYVIIAADTDPESPGFQGQPFTGSIDGAGHQISNLRIDGKSNDFVGLIGNVGHGGTITNLKLSDAVITNIGTNGGILAGQSSGSITGCEVSGSVRGNENIGGLIGCSQAGSIENCRAQVHVSGKYYIGGLLGYNNSGSMLNNQVMTDSEVYGVSASTHLGGLIGYSKGELVNCSSKAIVTGNNSTYVGGLIGYSLHSSLVKCFSDASVIAEGSSSYVGGLIGYCNSIDLEQCYNKGSVTAAIAPYVGGLVGYSLDSNINLGYSWGNVEGLNFVGGLIGYYDFGTIYYTYCFGQVTGNGYAGGLVGCNKYGNIYYSLWNKTSASNVILTVGADIGGQLVKVYGKSTDEMQMFTTFAMVNFDIKDLSINGTEDIWERDLNTLMPVFTWQDDAVLFSGGNGTVEDPFLIASALDLYRIVDYKWEYFNSHFKLISDIDMNEYDGQDGRKSFRIIGDNEPFSSQTVGKTYISSFNFIFKGSFDGNGHTIRNIKLNFPEKYYCGMFGIASAQVQIKNLNIDNCIVNGGQYTGGLVGQSEGVISGCTIEDLAVTGSTNSGGLIGYNKAGSITNCHVSGSIDSASNAIGGLAGYSTGTITESSALCTVNGNESVGGLCGSYSGQINNCQSTSNVTGYRRIGVLIGSSTSTGSVTSCKSYGYASGNDYVGGIVGYNTSLVSKCMSAAEITSTYNGGGLIGYCDTNSILSASYSEAVVNNAIYGGGLIGQNSYGQIKDCYNIGIVNSNSTNCGAVVGISYGSVTNCYSAASGMPANIRGFIGSGSGTYSNCYWNSEIAETTNGIGDNSADPATIIACSTAEMKQKATFAGFDFIGTEDGTDDIWEIRQDAEYPRLTWQTKTTGDIAGSYDVDIADICAIAECWLTEAGQQGWNDDIDIADNDKIDVMDFAVIASNWLK